MEHLLAPLLNQVALGLPLLSPASLGGTCPSGSQTT